MSCITELLKMLCESMSNDVKKLSELILGAETH